jgi:hypothetical protein
VASSGLAAAQCLGMRNIADLTSVSPDYSELFTGQPRSAVAAYLARFTGSSRQHTHQTYAAICPSAPGAA